MTTLCLQSALPADRVHVDGYNYPGPDRQCDPRCRKPVKYRVLATPPGRPSPVRHGQDDRVTDSMRTGFVGLTCRNRLRVVPDSARYGALRERENAL